MRPAFRLLMLLVVSLALRGFAGDAFALHQPAAMLMTMSEHQQHCPEETAPAQTTEHGKACQINCDFAAAAALPVFLKAAASPPPAVRIPTLTTLAIGDLPAPDHPPPIL